MLITYFDPARLPHLDTQVRNALKCTFVERLVLSSHNPAIDLAASVRVRDERVTLHHELQQRGCGHRWHVASTTDAEHLIVLDDDLLLYPRQLTILFDGLLADPGIPHGIAGMTRTGGGAFEYHDRCNQTVDFLCEAYAITRVHLERYLHLREQLDGDGDVGRRVDAAADFVLLSRTGSGRPRIHDIGRIFRCETFVAPSTAVHQRPDFISDVWAADVATERIIRGDAESALAPTPRERGHPH